MTETVYITFTRRGIERMLKTQPEAAGGEFPVAVTITIPDDVFKKRPIPVVEVTLTSPQVGAAAVTVDGQEQRVPADEAAQKQRVVQEQFARLFALARGSADPAMREIADDAFAALLDAGVEVRVVQEDAQPEGQRHDP